MPDLDRPTLHAAAAIIHTAATTRGIPHWHQIADRLTQAAPPAPDQPEEHP